MPVLTPMLKDLVVKNAQPGSERREISDGGSGLALIVQPSGIKTWLVRFRANGARIKKALGPYPTISLEKARQLARAERERADAGGAPVAAPLSIAYRTASRPVVQIGSEPTPMLTLPAPPLAPAAASGMTVGQCWDDFAARRLPKKTKGTQDRYGGIARNQILPEWKDKPVTAITRDDTNSLADRAEDQRGEHARNSIITVGSAFFTFILRQNLIMANPWDKVEKLILDNRTRVLSDDEIKVFWAACDELGPIFGPMFQLLLLTGCRRGEVSGMKWSEISVAKRTWKIPKSRTKNKRPHSVYLTDGMLAVIAKMPKDDDCDFVFSTNGKTSSTGYSKAKIQIDEIAPIAEASRVRRGAAQIDRDEDEWTLHDLRRTFATGAGELRIPEVDIEKCLNHPKGKVAGTYNRATYSAEMKAAWIKWGKHVASLVRSKQRVASKKPGILPELVM